MVFKTYFNIERLIHAAKTAIACIVGFLLARFIGLPADQWIVITIIVVMCSQIYVGSVLQKAYLRFLGTMIGCLFATVTLITAGHSGIAIAAAIGISSFIFSYMAVSRENLSYAGTLGAVTTAIIMLGQTPTILFALERFLEISIGIFIATIVSQFVLPINARTHLRRAQANTLGQLSEYYTAAMMTKNDGALETDFHELDERIVKSLLRQRQLAKESASERLGSVFDRAHFMQSLYYERELLRAMTFMHNAKSNIRNADYVLINSPAAHAFNETVLQSLETIIKAIEKDRPEQEHVHIPSLEGLKEELQKNLETPSRDQLIYIDGFLFCAELLTKGLGMLAELYSIQIYHASSAPTPSSY